MLDSFVDIDAEQVLAGVAIFWVLFLVVLLVIWLDSLKNDRM